MFGVEFNGKGGSLSKQAKLSKQVIDIWHSVLEPERSLAQFLLIALLVVALHSIPFFIPESMWQSSKESAPKTEAVKVRITQTSPKAEPVPEATAEQTPAPTKKKNNASTQPREILTASEKATDSLNQPTLVPAPTNKPEANKPETPSTSRKSALMEEKVSPLLPSGKDDFIAHQRHLGETIGAGAIAGDIDIPDVVTEKNPNDPVTRTEYTFAGYFDSLSRRFVETWGSVRSLPPHSRFEGKVGEFIEYDIVINRDGSLRKIVNISAKREPYRDFAAVDDLVQSVFRTMFPFQPVPARIRNDPLVIRKRIQFVGFKYTLY